MSLIILQTSDVHGFLYPHNYVENKNIGLLRFEQYINDLRKDNDVLLIDSGDFIQGSPLTYFLNKFQNYKINPLVEQMNAFKYTVFTLGNHEFNYGLDYLKTTLKDFKGDILEANISGLENYLDVVPYKIYEYNDAKVGIIGLTTSHIRNWEKEENIPGLEFLDIVEIYKKYEKELKEKCDIVLVNYHGGFENELDNLDVPTETLTRENEGCRLIKNHDSIDILLTGHQHREIAQKINNTICMQPGYQALNMSYIKIDQKKIVDYKLVNLQDKKINPVENLQQQENLVQKFLDQVIGHIDQDMLVENLFDARINGHALINFIHKVQFDLTNASISAVSLFDTAIGFKKEISVRDIIANYPFPNTLKVIKITKEDLKEAIEISASYFENKNGTLTVSQKFSYPKPQHYNYDMFSGVEYTIDVNMPIGSRVTITSILENEITIVLNNYRATNFSWYPMYENKELVEEITIDMVELLINYITKNKSFIVDNTNNFKVIYQKKDN
ncbi:MAG: bifunctional metallophosphatase/5'-nucleotidase [Mycoplasmatales bacterium]